VKAKKYPAVLEEQGERVVIRKVRDHGSEAFRIEYYVAGQRRMKTRADENEAHIDAGRILAMLNERAPVFSQTEDATIYLAAKTVLGGLAPVDVACREWAVAMQRLGGASLLYAVEVYKKIVPQKTGRKIPELVVEYGLSLEDDMSPAYRSRVCNRLERFAARFPGALHEVTANDMEAWIKGFNLGKRARNNERETLVAFSRWAQNQKYLALGAPVEASQIKKLDAPTTITIFPVATVTKLMLAMFTEKPELVPYAALGFFAGVRPAELTRLRFEEAIRWNFGDIEIRADQAKTGFRRLTKMQANLAAWLAPYRESISLIAPPNAYKKLSAFARSKGFTWTPDVMRHSYISYAVAFTQQIGQVALWAGNSESIIKRHYLERVTETEGKAFFAILPTGSDKPKRVRKAAKA
jgi:integrase